MKNKALAACVLLASALGGYFLARDSGIRQLNKHLGMLDDTHFIEWEIPEIESEDSIALYTIRDGEFFASGLFPVNFESFQGERVLLCLRKLDCDDVEYIEISAEPGFCASTWKKSYPNLRLAEDIHVEHFVTSRDAPLAHLQAFSSDGTESNITFGVTICESAGGLEQFR